MVKKDGIGHCKLCSVGGAGHSAVNWYSHVEGKKHMNAFNAFIKRKSLEEFKKENGSSGVPAAFLSPSELLGVQESILSLYKAKMPSQMTPALKQRYCEFIVRSGKELKYKCKLCARETHHIVGWIFHMFQVDHTSVSFNKILKIGIAEYFSKFRNVPGPCCIHFGKFPSWAPRLPPFLLPGIQGTDVAARDPGISPGKISSSSQKAANLEVPEGNNIKMIQGSKKPVKLDLNIKGSQNKTQTPKSNLVNCSTPVIKEATMVTSLSNKSAPPIQPQLGENLKFQEAIKAEVTQCPKENNIKKAQCPKVPINHDRNSNVTQYPTPKENHIKMTPCSMEPTQIDLIKAKPLFIPLTRTKKKKSRIRRYSEDCSTEKKRSKKRKNRCSKDCSTQVTKGVTMATSLSNESGPQIEPQLGENFEFPEGSNANVTHRTKKQIKLILNNQEYQVKTQTEKKSNLSSGSISVIGDVTAAPVQPQFGETCLESQDEPDPQCPIPVFENPLLSKPSQQPYTFAEGESSKSTLHPANGLAWSSMEETQIWNNPGSSVVWTCDKGRRGCSQNLHTNLITLTESEPSPQETSDWIVSDAVFDGSIADENDFLKMDFEIGYNIPEESNGPDDICPKTNEFAREKFVQSNFQKENKLVSIKSEGDSNMRLIQERQTNSGSDTRSIQKRPPDSHSGTRLTQERLSDSSSDTRLIQERHSGSDTRSTRKRQSDSCSNTRLIQERHSDSGSDTRLIQERHSDSGPDIRLTQERHSDSGSDTTSTQKRQSDSDTRLIQERHSDSGSDTRLIQERHSDSGSDTRLIQERHSDSRPDIRLTQERHSDSGSNTRLTQEMQSDSGSLTQERQSDSGSDTRLTQERQSDSGSDTRLTPEIQSDSGSDTRSVQDRHSDSGSDTRLAQERQSNSYSSTRLTQERHSDSCSDSGLIQERQSDTRLTQEKQCDSGCGSDEFDGPDPLEMRERSVTQEKGTKRKLSREESSDGKRAKCDDDILENRWKERSCDINYLDSAKQEAQARLEQLVKCLRVSNSADSDSLMKFGDLLDPDALLQVLNPGFLDSVNKLCELLDGDKDPVKLNDFLDPGAVPDEGRKELLEILDMECEL